MEGPGREEVATPGAPLGLRLAILFVWIFIVGMVFICVGFTLLAIITVGGSALGEHPFPEGLVVSLIVAIVEAFLIGMLSGAIWLTMLLEGRSAGTSPGHPGRKIGSAMLTTLVVAALIALLVWVPSIFLHGISKTFPWPLVWSCIGGGALWLHLHLDRTLPK